jgi:hypothetical protein
LEIFGKTINDSFEIPLFQRNPAAHFANVESDDDFTALQTEYEGLSQELSLALIARRASCPNSSMLFVFGIAHYLDP